MRLATLAAALVSGLLSSGCLVVSLQPFYEDDSIEFDEALVGEWDNVEDQSTIRMERGPWRSYRVSYVRAERTEVYSGHLTQVGNLRLLDLAWRGEPEASLRVHFPLRVQVLADTLTLAPLDFEWFSREAEHNRPPALRPAMDEEGTVLLTAPTAAVRAWLAAHAAEHFDEPVRFTRRPAR